MGNLDILENKRILVVDDEIDVLDTIVDLLDMCQIDTASDFESAHRFLNQNVYDIAILDIMGVRGYDLLETAHQKDLPTLMLTAHALSPESFVKSMQNGANAYVPKEKLAEIEVYVADVLEAHQNGIQRSKNWYARLKSFFDKQFGYDWLDGYKEAQEKYEWLDFHD